MTRRSSNWHLDRTAPPRAFSGGHGHLRPVDPAAFDRLRRNRLLITIASTVLCWLVLAAGIFFALYHLARSFGA